MVFTISRPPDISEGLPFDIGRLVRDGTGQETPPDSAGFDVSFGALGFRLRPKENSAYERATEQTRKQQIDTSNAAGEQSLSNWWFRSQASWDMGAGVKWYDRIDDTADARYYQSQGIDIWEPGELTLLRRMDVAPGTLPPGAHGYVCSFDTSAGAGYLEWRGETVRRFNNAAVAHTATTGTTGTTFSQPLAVGGVAFSAGLNGVWKYDPASTSLTKPITYTLTTRARVWYTKARLFIAVANVLYAVAITKSGALVAGEILYTHDDTAWTWTGVTEAAGAVLASGYSSGTSSILRFALGVDGSNNPILEQSGTVQEMPHGETIRAMGSYLGTTLVLGTTRGVRVGQLNSAGDVQLGPLTVETINPVVGVTFDDRFAYATLEGGHLDGKSGAVRVDLSAPIGDTGRCAYAPDVELETATGIESIATLGGRVILSTTTGLFIASSSSFVTQGVLDTGRIRFGTTEQKAFRFLRVSCRTNQGAVILSVVDEAGTEQGVVSMDDTFSTTSDLPIVAPGGRLLNQYLSFRVYLNASGDATSSPVLSSLSVKAVPAAQRIRLIQYPLSLFAQEVGAQGMTYRSDPYQRLRALEVLEETSAPIRVRDYRTHETFTGQIDSINFVGPYAADRGGANYGGVATVIVRKLG
jgi:hypothetical protein